MGCTGFGRMFEQQSPTLLSFPTPIALPAFVLSKPLIHILLTYLRRLVYTPLLSRFKSTSAV